MTSITQCLFYIVNLTLFIYVAIKYLVQKYGLNLAMITMLLLIKHGRKISHYFALKFATKKFINWKLFPNEFLLMKLLADGLH